MCQERVKGFSWREVGEHSTMWCALAPPIRIRSLAQGCLTTVCSLTVWVEEQSNDVFKNIELQREEDSNAYVSMRLSYATLRLASLSAYYFSISRLSRYAKTAAERAGWKYVEDNKPSFKLASINFPHPLRYYLF